LHAQELKSDYTNKHPIAVLTWQHTRHPNDTAHGKFFLHYMYVNTSKKYLQKNCLKTF